MTSHILREKQLLTQAFYSNAGDVVKQGQYIFNTFCVKAIPAEERIKEIEQGIMPDFIETIREADRVHHVGFDMVKKAKEEILILFSTAKAFDRQKRAGMIELLGTIAMHGVKVRILVPGVANIPQEPVLEKDERGQATEKMLIRFLESHLHTRVSILIVDRKLSLSVELKNDEKYTSSEAIGLTSYSNSTATVLSYVSFFETMWLQAELYDKLKMHDKIQKEFIDVAAHDIQQYRELLEAINRNSKRLQGLTNDILDITKIESQTLQLKKEKNNLNELILGAISDCKSQIKKEAINLNFIFIAEENIFIEADRLRLNHVLDNVFNNAIKFTKARAHDYDTNNENTITIILQRNIKDKEKGKDYDDSTNYDSEAIISVKDTGIGIDPEIFPRLFTKFATKSDKGAGLGLFICKSVVEAHGGAMWAENNTNNNGATNKNQGAIFYFHRANKQKHLK